MECKMNSPFNTGSYGDPELLKIALQSNPEIDARDFARELSIRLEGESVENQKEASLFQQFRQLLPVDSTKKFDCEVIHLASPLFQYFYCNEVLSSFEHKEEGEKWIDEMVAIFGKEVSFKKLLSTSTKVELMRSLSSENLFREDSLSTTLSVSYTIRHCDNAVKKSVKQFMMFLRKQKKWPDGYVVNNSHLKGKTLSSVKENSVRFECLIRLFAENFLRKQKTNSGISEILRMREKTVADSGYKAEDAERAGASLYWLRLFGKELMNEFQASKKAPDDPEWSVILSIQTLLTKISSGCPIITDQDLINHEKNHVKTKHFNREWSKVDYQALLQNCHEILTPYFKKFMKRLSLSS